MTTTARLAEQLTESDCRYFEAAATVVPVPGGVFALMAGLEPVLGAAVVQRVSADEIGNDGVAWIHDVVGRFRAAGCAAARIYFNDPAGPLVDALEAAGFERRLEIGYVVRGALGGEHNGVVLRTIAGDDDWEAKRKLHAGSEIAADGHMTAAEDWVELERRKCDSGIMTGLLIEVGGEVCGGVCTLQVGEIVRAKNLFVHPDRRRTGIAAATMCVLSRRAADMGKAAVGIFGVPGNPGNAVYLRLGMDAVVRQYEWTKRLRP